MIWSGNMSVADRVNRKPRHVHRSAFQRPPRVQTRQQQQVLDETCYPLGLRCHPAHRVCDGLGIVPYPLRQFRVTTDRRKGSSQFMTGIGNELAHTGFTGLPRRQCGSDVVEHPVERRPELPHLGGGVCVRFGHPDR
ncbi:Uncharacterised protein [Mycobacterium tuberculosis]|nr:Uncharacterised protein [Mycobacterium tuberculosis]COX50208.1 Uncharacterised protein [Mycobacterium tuberculosis]